MRSPMWNVKVKVWWFFHHGRGVALARRVARTKATLTRMWRWIQPFSAKTIAEPEEFTRLARWFALVLQPRKKESCLWVEYPICQPDGCTVRFGKRLFRLTIMPMGWTPPGEDPWDDVEILRACRSDLVRAARRPWELLYSTPQEALGNAMASVRKAIHYLRTEDMRDLPLKHRVLREVFLWLVRDLEALDPVFYFDLDKERFTKEDAAAHTFKAFVWRLTGWDLSVISRTHSTEIFLRQGDFPVSVVVSLHLWLWRVGLINWKTPLFKRLVAAEVGPVSVGVIRYDGAQLADLRAKYGEGRWL